MTCISWRLACFYGVTKFQFYKTWVFRPTLLKESFFDIFYIKGFNTGLNYSHWDSCLRWFIGVKYSQMFIQIKTPRGLGIIAGWGYLPISMVLRSEEVWNRRCWVWRGHQNTGTILVCKSNNSEEDSLDWWSDSQNWIVIVVDRFIFMLSYRTVVSNKTFVQTKKNKKKKKKLNRLSKRLHEIDWL